MKKSAMVSLLALSAFAITPGMMSFRGVAQQPGGQVQLDPAEYADYQTAEKTTDPAGKAAALQGYLTKYPKSPIKAAVLREIMLGYAGSDPGKAITAADQLLQLTPNDLQADALEAILRNAQGSTDAAADYAQKGLDATKPDAMSDADFKAQKDYFAHTLYSIIGNSDFKKKDYPGAINAFKSELSGMKVEDTQTPGQALQDTYYLGSAYYSSTPPDLVNCTFYATRAASYAPANFQAQMQPLATYCYKKYHGGADGYDAVQAAAKANLNPPDGFTIKPAPTPADQVAALLASTSDADLPKLAIDDKEYIIENGTQEQADKVFNTIKGKTTEIPDAVVVSATADQLMVSISSDAVQGKKADFTYNMKTPLKTIPAAGDKVALVGTYASYTKTPVSIVMSDGSIAPKKAAAPVRHTTTHH